MTHREGETFGRAFARWTVTIAALYLIAALPAVAVPLAFTLKPTTTDEAGAALPATGAGALTAHRVEYGTCLVTGTVLSFGAAFGEVVLAMPQVAGSFDVPLGTYCVRAFPKNGFGEGKPYPLGIMGPAPSGDGSIIVLRQGP